MDFAGLERHGIFREIPVRYAYDQGSDRAYDLYVFAVTDAAGRSWPVDESSRGGNVVIRIGDPDRTVTGRQSYRITYTVAGALNAFADHDELFWNATGEWPVPTRQASAAVRLERGAMTRVGCFQGRAGSTEGCRSSARGGSATFEATRPLAAGEQLTIVAALPKGAVAEPRPRLVPRERAPGEFFELTPVTVGLAAIVVAVGAGLVFAAWLIDGRDRRYLKRYYLDGGTTEVGRALFEHEPLVAEYEPPEGLRPAEVGLILDERADPKDLTATIIHLAVRGYLSIEELPPQGLFGRRDWALHRTRAADDALAVYERRIFEGLFDDGDDVKLSELRGSFHGTLHEAQSDLYRAAVKRRWFPDSPLGVRAAWQIVGAVLVVIGGILAFLLGLTAGGGLIGAALAADGTIVLAASGAMPRRTGAGRELLLRTLGFRRYMETAETERQRFAEREGIFAEYLPYAIVFGSVTKWARAFAGLDAERATRGWYTGAAVADVGSVSNDLAGFTSSVSSAISSTPGSSGLSGFGGGGSAGGGGGGGGGGSW